MLADGPVPNRAVLADVFAGYVASSRSGREYRVALRPDGTWTCECPAVSYGSRGDGECKHIDLARSERERRMTLAYLLC